MQKLVRRYQREGPAAFQPRSRRPHSNPRAVDLEVDDRIVRLRKTLTKNGLDAGAETIAAHLAAAGVSPVPAVSTVWLILSRRGFVDPQPQKRLRSSWKTSDADQPNERWQANITHWRLADGSDVEILNILDDHSRVNLAAKARRVTGGQQVVPGTHGPAPGGVEMLVAERNHLFDAWNTADTRGSPAADPGDLHRPALFPLALSLV